MLPLTKCFPIEKINRVTPTANKPGARAMRTTCVGQLIVNGTTEPLQVQEWSFNGKAMFTASGPYTCQDFAKRAFAVRHLKRVFAACPVEWSE
jgi:hypothetical protein